MNEQPIEVFFTASNSYIQHVSAVIQSIIEKTTSLVNFHVVCNDISDKSKNYLTEMLSKTKHKVFYYVVDAEAFAGFKCNISYISLDTYFRFVIPSLNPSLKKAIYLDADVILNGDLAELWNIDLGDNYVGAIQDKHIETSNYKDTIGLKDEEPYFNAGVLLLNLDAIRKDGLEQKFFENTKLLSDKMKYQDQDVLNYSFKGRVKLIPHRFNYMTTDVRSNDEVSYQNAVIFHFTGPHKPWTKYNKGSNPAYALYYKALRKTPYWKQFYYLILANPLGLVNKTRIGNKRMVSIFGVKVMNFYKNND